MVNRTIELGDIEDIPIVVLETGMREHDVVNVIL